MKINKKKNNFNCEQNNDKVNNPQYEGQKYINFREVPSPSSVSSSLTDVGGDTSLKLIYFPPPYCGFLTLS